MTTDRGRLTGAVLLVLTGTLLTAGCTGSSSGRPSGPATGTVGAVPYQPEPPVASVGTALVTVSTLRVQGRGAKTGYSREQFGPAWADVDRNGCDTRNDVLGRDLTAVALRAGTNGCVVVTGRLADPYSGTSIPFSKGHAADVQIDHVVALSDAWQKGAAQWSPAKRLAFANDPLNLLAVDGSANTSKRDSDAASWLPPDKGFRCSYVARQVAVKRTYGVWVTAAERDAMVRVLQTCPGEPLPTGGLPSLPAGTAAASPAVAGSGTASPVFSGTTYASCSDARAHGAGPFYRGGPGYVPSQDGDGDGIACER